jgi:hypothetical protein
MITNGEEEMIWKEAFVTYLKVKASPHSTGEKGKSENMTADKPAEIRAWYLTNRSLRA